MSMINLHKPNDCDHNETSQDWSNHNYQIKTMNMNIMLMMVMMVMMMMMMMIQLCQKYWRHQRRAAPKTGSSIWIDDNNVEQDDNDDDDYFYIWRLWKL